MVVVVVVVVVVDKYDDDDVVEIRGHHISPLYCSATIPHPQVVMVVVLVVEMGWDALLATRPSSLARSATIPFIPSACFHCYQDWCSVPTLGCGGWECPNCGSV